MNMNSDYPSVANPFPFNYFDCSCNVIDCSGVPVCCNNCGRCQCTGSPCLFTPGMREITQKRIQKQVAVFLICRCGSLILPSPPPPYAPYSHRADTRNPIQETSPLTSQEMPEIQRNAL